MTLEDVHETVHGEELAQLCAIILVARGRPQRHRGIRENGRRIGREHFHDRFELFARAPAAVEHEVHHGRRDGRLERARTRLELVHAEQTLKAPLRLEESARRVARRARQIAQRGARVLARL